MARFSTTAPPSDVRCPTCGAPAEPGQLVCLECGSRVALGYRRPPDWRLPAAIVAVVLLLALVTTAVALNRVGDEAEQEVARTPVKVKQPEAGKNEKAATKTAAAKKPAAKEPAAAKKPAPKKEPAAKKEAPAAQAPASATGLVQRGALWSWPRDLKGFTVVLLSAEDRASAERFARSATEGKPAKVGVIRADDFESLPKGFYIVFAGRYKDRATADKAAARLGQRFSGAFPQAVTP